MAALIDRSHAYFAENLRRHRHAARLNQAVLARRVGVHQTLISLYERGLRPTDPHVDLLARALGVTSADLLRRCRRRVLRTAA
jgi:transcriptional regulator with XRE-family HTH domain